MSKFDDIEEVKIIGEDLGIEFTDDMSEFEYRRKVAERLEKEDPYMAQEILSKKSLDEWGEPDRQQAFERRKRFERNRRDRAQINGDTYPDMDWEDFDRRILHSGFEKVYQRAVNDTADEKIVVYADLYTGWILECRTDGYGSVSSPTAHAEISPGENQFQQGVEEVYDDIYKAFSEANTLSGSSVRAFPDEEEPPVVCVSIDARMGFPSSIRSIEEAFSWSPRERWFPAKHLFKHLTETDLPELPEDVRQLINFDSSDKEFQGHEDLEGLFLYR